MGLRILLTNLELWPPTGTVLYVRDLALKLQQMGHSPAVLSTPVGAIARELLHQGIPVSTRRSRLPDAPDVIHGHHFAPTRLALRLYPDTPAISVCHDHRSPHDRAPIHPRVRRHFAVSRLCVERVVRDGVPDSLVQSLPNFVDTDRFQPRPPLPERPRRALVFSNYARAQTQLPAVEAACRRVGLELDVLGSGARNITTRPELLLGGYDIVFAKAKAAMEAMAIGAAVVLCDFSGVGPMVTTDRFDLLRSQNFGFEALSDPLQPDVLLRQIQRYDPLEAARVRDRIRACASLAAAADRLVTVYREVIDEHHRAPADPAPADVRSLLRERLRLRMHWALKSLPPERLAKLRRVPGARLVERIARTLVE